MPSELDSAPWLEAKRHLARLQHAWHLERHPGEPYPPDGSLWWEDHTDPEVRAVIEDIRNGYDEERDKVQPAVFLLDALAEWAVRQRGIDRVAADAFADDMLFGHKSARHEGWVGGYLQNPHWAPSAAVWRKRLEDHRPIAHWLPIGEHDDEGVAGVQVADPRPDPSMLAILAEADREHELRRERWSALGVSALERVKPADRARIARWGAWDEQAVEVPTPGLSKPKDRFLPNADAAAKSRARRAFFEAAATGAGFSNPCAFARALLREPENAPLWRAARQEWTREEWEARTNALRSETMGPNLARDRFARWAIARAWSIAGVLPLPNAHLHH